MVTKEQALTEQYFLQIAELLGETRLIYGSMASQFIANGQVKPLHKSRAWRANGKCKTWKRDSERFQLPIKHGLYNYGYITNENCYLFDIKP